MTNIVDELKQCAGLKAAEDGIIGGDRTIKDVLNDAIKEIEFLRSLTGPVFQGPTAHELFDRIKHAKTP